MPERPRALTLGVVLAAVTAVGLLAYAVFVLEQAATQSADSDAGAAVVIGSVLIWLVVVTLAARGLLRRRRWARSPLVMTYLLLLAVAIVISVPIACIVNKMWLDFFASRVSITPGLIAVNIAILGLISGSIVFSQAWKVSTANPVESLRAE